MYVKQSLFEAEKEAKELSIKNPNIVYYVIDKKRGKAACYSIEWIVRQRIAFENYFPVCTYRNGIRRF